MTGPYLALATDAAVSPFVPLPTLCGVYADRDEAAAYVRWENERADDSVYYLMDAADMVLS